MIGLLVGLPSKPREGVKALCGRNLSDSGGGDEARGNRSRHGLFVRVWSDEKLSDVASNFGAPLEHGKGALALLEGVQSDCLVEDGGYMGEDVAVLCGSLDVVGECLACTHCPGKVEHVEERAEGVGYFDEEITGEGGAGRGRGGVIHEERPGHREAVFE